MKGCLLRNGAPEILLIRFPPSWLFSGGTPLFLELRPNLRRRHGGLKPYYRSGWAAWPGAKHPPPTATYPQDDYETGSDVCHHRPPPPAPSRLLPLRLEESILADIYIQWGN